MSLLIEIPFITIKWHLNHLVEADIYKIMECVENVVTWEDKKCKQKNGFKLQMVLNILLEIFFRSM